jgi:hypothetical protein
MSHSLRSILSGCDGRYPTAEERGQLEAFAHELPKRVKASVEVEAHEGAIVSAVVDALREHYPRYEKLFPQAWDRCAREVQFVLRSDVRAMLAGDPRELDDKALVYLRSVLAAYNLTPQFVRDCFTLVRDQCRERLSAQAFAHLEPFLQRNVQVLADFPEPAVAAV